MLPTFARVDGRAFHSFTRGMNRPYDDRMATSMGLTLLFLMKETNALFGHTQSDEITLMWYSSDTKSQIWFDGRHSKMVSQIAALATVEFYRLTVENMPDRARLCPTFDARVWQVPTLAEAANVFLWREQDATRNSLTMAAQTMYSDKELHGKDSSDKQEMLFQKGINWNDYPAFFKRGIYARRKKIVRPFTTDEILLLPEKHEARTNPELTVERSSWVLEDLPVLSTVENKIEMIFEGKNPIVKKAKVVDDSD